MELKKKLTSHFIKKIKGVSIHLWLEHFQSQMNKNSFIYQNNAIKHV